MDTSQTFTREHERALGEGVMVSDIPTQSIDEKSRLTDLHLASVGDENVVKEHAQWRQPEMKVKNNTQNRTVSGSSFMADGGGPVLSARVAEECSRISGRALTEGEGRTFADPA